MKNCALIALALLSAFYFGATVGRDLFVPADKIPPERRRFHFALEQLRQLKNTDGVVEVGLAESGMGSRPDSFYLLFRYVSVTANPPQLVDLLKDKSAAVRVAAAMAILKVRNREVRPEEVDILLNDPERVIAFDGSCTPRPMTVGRIVSELKKNPRFMDIVFASP